MHLAKKRRKLRSPAWNYFDASQDRSYGECKLCYPTIIVNTINGSSINLYRHLQAVHGINLDNEHGSSSVPSSSLQVASEELICKLVVNDGLSFSTIATSSTLRQVFVSNGFKNYPASPSTVRDIVVKFYCLKASKLKEEITAAIKTGKKFSVTLDEWTSAAHKRYMNVNLHSLRGQFWNLGLVRITGTLTAENAIAYLKDKLNEFGVTLKHHVVAVVTDGAANMKKMGSLTETQHQLCFAHGLHLSVLDVLYDKSPVNFEEDLECDDEMEEDDLASEFVEEDVLIRDLCISIKEIVEKVRKTVKLFRKSPKKTEILHKYTKQSKNKELGLILDCKTRWNSLLDMLERILFVRHELQKSMIDLGLSMDISDLDFLTIQGIVALLSPVKVVTEAICRRDATLVTCDVAIKFALDKISQHKTDLGIKLFNSMRTRLSERRSILSATISHIHFSNSDQKLYGSLPCATRATKAQITEKIKDIYCTESQGNSATSSPLVHDLSEEFVDSPLEFCLEAELNEAISEAMATKNILTSTKSTTLSISRELACHASGEPRGVILQSVYDDLMTVPPSTVEAERVFSCASGFCTKTRSRLSDSTLHALVWLKSYFKRSI